MPVVPPESPEDVTAELLAGALAPSGVLHGSRLSRVEVSTVADPGQAAQTVRAALHYEGDPAPGAPRSLIAKFGSAHQAMRDLSDAAGVYRREVRVYADLADDLGVGLPRAYAAIHDREHRNFLLLLEDLADCRAGSPFSCSPADVAQGLRAIASMHARWWGSARLEETRWVFSLHHPSVLAFWAQQTSAALPVLREGIAYPTPDVMLSALERFAEQPERLTAPDAGTPETLTHGDYHPQNLFFEGEDGAGRFAVIDWQLTSRGDGFFDAARLIAFGLPAEVRRDTEDELLREYVEALAAAGYPVDPDEVRPRYRLGLLRNAIQMAFLLPTVNPEAFHRPNPTTGERFSDATLGRLFTAVEDHEAGALLG